MNDVDDLRVILFLLSVFSEREQAVAVTKLLLHHERDVDGAALGTLRHLQQKMRRDRVGSMQQSRITRFF